MFGIGPIELFIISITASVMVGMIYKAITMATVMLQGRRPRDE